MATSHSNEHALIPAVGYLRRSTQKQEKSREDQKREIEHYASQHGYQLKRWFIDDGISGDSTEVRHGFLDMHKAACNGKDFDFILAWDFSRFGRFDSVELGYWVHPLRQAGVKLVTVAEGLVSWDDFGGRVMSTITAEGKHSFLTDLSRNVCRSMAPLAMQGFLLGQSAPYGYDRMLIDEAGNAKQRIHNGERFAKPRSWRAKLVPSDDAIKLQTVREIFQTYADTDIGLRGLADSLNSRKIPGPTGGAWYAASIKAMLENQNYVGTFTWAKRREGKYHRVQAGHVFPRERGEVRLSRSGKPLAKDNPREAWIVKDNAHEALIIRDTFEKVQAKLKQRKRSNEGQSYRTHTKQNNDAYLLSGLVFCAHCGCKMHGSNLKAKGHDYFKYICSTYARSGKNNPSGCGCHQANQTTLVNVVIQQLQEKLLNESALDSLKIAIKKQLQAKLPKANQVDAMRQSLASLERDIAKAADNYLKAPTELLETIGERLTAMKRQRDQLQAELKTTRQTPQADLENQINATFQQAHRLQGAISQATPAMKRELFRQAVERIDLRFDHVPKGKRVECPLIAGEITINVGLLSIFGSVSRSDRTRLELFLANLREWELWWQALREIA